MSTRRGHATASMAGRLADTVQADLLVLNHLGDTAGASQDPSKDALTVIKGGTRVLTALDMMEVAIPRTGFRFRETAAATATTATTATTSNDHTTTKSLLPPSSSGNTTTTILEKDNDWKAAPPATTIRHAELLPKEGTKVVRKTCDRQEPETVLTSASL